MRTRHLVLVLVPLLAAGLWLVLRAEDGGSADGRAQARPAEGPGADGVTLEVGTSRGKAAPPAPPGASDGATAAAANPGMAVSALTVRVTDSEYEPIRAHVAVHTVAGTLEKDTDEHGQARFEGLARGTAKLLVTALGRVMTSGRECDLDEPDVAVDVTMEPGEALKGRTVDAADGRPVAGALVDVRHGGRIGGTTWYGYVSSYAEVRSDAEGRFLIPGLPRDTVVTVTAVARAYRATERTLHVVAIEGERPVMELRMEAGGWVRGTVTDRSGKPVPRATVYAFPEGNQELRGEPGDDKDPGVVDRPLTARTDAQGRYLVEGVGVEEPWCVTATCPGFGRSEDACGLSVSATRTEAHADLVLRGAGLLVVHLVDGEGRALLPDEGAQWGLRKGKADPDGVLRFRDLPPGTYPFRCEISGFLPLDVPVEVREAETTESTFRLERGVAVAGVVVDEAGRPWANVDVHCRPVLGTGGTVRTSTDAEGQFVLRGLAAREYRVETYEGVGTRLLATVTAPREGLRLTLPRARRVVARFTLPAGGAPPTECWRHAYAEDGSGSGSTIVWDDGKIEWEVGIGVHLLMLRPTGYAPWERKVDVGTRESLDLGDIPLDVGLELSGKVTDREGRPLEGVVLETNDRHAATTQSASDGSFRLPHLRPGPVTLEATASGLVSSRLALDQPATGVRITLSRGGVLVGNVSDASGGAPGEVDVSVLDTQDEDAIGRYDYPRLDARGNFRSRLLPGRYVVTASRDGEALAKVEVTLDEGQEARVALTLPVR